MVSSVEVPIYMGLSVGGLVLVCDEILLGPRAIQIRIRFHRSRPSHFVI